MYIFSPKDFFCTFYIFCSLAFGNFKSPSHPPSPPFFGCWCQFHSSTAINMKNKRCYQTCETRSVETEVPCGKSWHSTSKTPSRFWDWRWDYTRHYTDINDSVSRWVELGDILKRWNSHKTVPINHISLSERWAKADLKHSCLLTSRVLTTKPNQLAEKRRRKDLICCTLKKERKSNDHQSLYSTIW